MHSNSKFTGFQLKRVVGALAVSALTVLVLAGCTDSPNSSEPAPASSSSEAFDVTQEPKQGALALEEHADFAAQYNRFYAPMSEQLWQEQVDFVLSVVPDAIVQGTETVEAYVSFESFTKDELERVITAFRANGWTVMPELTTGATDNGYAVLGYKGDLKLDIFNNGEDMVVIYITGMIPNE